MNRALLYVSGACFAVGGLVHALTFFPVAAIPRNNVWTGPVLSSFLMLVPAVLLMLVVLMGLYLLIRGFPKDGSPKDQKTGRTIPAYVWILAAFVLGLGYLHLAALHDAVQSMSSSDQLLKGFDDPNLRWRSQSRMSMLLSGDALLYLAFLGSSFRKARASLGARPQKS